ncbi:MAG: Flp family type IVb pilin [Planctomycetota bacterium]|nr:Flp family type IVb pilin [Planctomycetota bacterium]
MSTFFKQFVRDRTGATMVEYALLLALIALTCIFAVKTTGVRLRDSFGKASAAMTVADQRVTSIKGNRTSD